MIFRRDQFERPYRDVAAQAVAACDLPVELAETGVQIGTARYGTSLAQCRVDDPDCTVSLPIAQALVKKVTAGQ